MSTDIATQSFSEDRAHAVGAIARQEARRALVAIDCNRLLTIAAQLVGKSESQASESRTYLDASPQPYTLAEA